MKIFVLLLTLLPFALMAAPKGSGTGCSAVTMGQQGYIKAAQLAEKLTTYLERKSSAKGTKVVLLGRAGSNSPESRFQKKVSPYWNYTHAGIAYKNHSHGRWTIVHLLNDCGEESSIYAESPMKFFFDDPYEYRVAVAIPSPALQDKLELLIVERNMATAVFNNSVYSSVSNPFNTQRQNSNEYILDTLTLAIAHNTGVTNLFTREQVKAYMLESGLNSKVEPEQVKVKGLESFGLALGFGPKNATLDDHPRNQRPKGRVNMVSVGTLIQYLQNTELLESTTELALAEKDQAADTKYHE